MLSLVDATGFDGVNWIFPKMEPAVDFVSDAEVVAGGGDTRLILEKIEVEVDEVVALVSPVSALALVKSPLLFVGALANTIDGLEADRVAPKAPAAVVVAEAPKSGLATGTEEVLKRGFETSEDTVPPNNGVELVGPVDVVEEPKIEVEAVDAEFIPRDGVSIESALLLGSLLGIVAEATMPFVLDVSKTFPLGERA